MSKNRLILAGCCGFLSGIFIGPINLPLAILIGLAAGAVIAAV